jgi:cell wall-associated NlpC family hydrolase
MLLIGGAAILLLPVLVTAAASGGNTIASPSETAETTIPPEFLSLYMQAGVESGVPWQLLAAVGKVECNHGQSPNPACTQEGVENTAGAGGPMQFLAGTWNQYGLDANNDGTADRWDPADAIFSAANYLKASGAPDNAEAALYAYNHSQAYVQKVLAWANLYTDANPSSSNEPTPTSPNDATTTLSGAAAQVAVAYALAQLGTPYRWGGEGPGGFDCSGLVQAAYASAGIWLPRVAQAQYDATAGEAVPTGQPLAPGELVFFGADPADVTHVGIVVSPGQMVDAPHTGAVVRIESYDWPDYLGATRPASPQGAGR